MRTAETPLRDRLTSYATWTVGVLVIVVAGVAMSLMPEPVNLQPGSLVSYSEDLVGRPWTIVRRVGHQLYEVENDKVLVIVEAKTLSRYRGLANDVTPEMMGDVSQTAFAISKHNARFAQVTSKTQQQ